jgi:hypothetical protein
LLTRPDLILALVTDAQGEARIALPGPLDPGLRLFVQSAVIAAPAPALDFATSSAADLTLQPTGVHVTWAVPNFRDPLRSTTQSGKSWRPTELGGSGLLGDFDLELLRKTARTDAKGRILYEWDIDDFTVPGDTDPERQERACDERHLRVHELRRAEHRACGAGRDTAGGDPCLRHGRDPRRTRCERSGAEPALP